MKIISKFKDYYDYLQGIYGVDEKLTLDRTKFYSMTYVPSNITVSTLHIGEWMIQGFWSDKSIYFGNQVEQFATKRVPNWLIGDPSEYWFIRDHSYSNSRHVYKYITCLKEPMYLGDKSPTWKWDYPILLLDDLMSAKDDEVYIKCPILKEYSVNKMLPAERTWLILSEWLGKQITKKEPVVPVGDDKVRIISAGFDLKKSFRH